jgi:hypothetical protein
MIQPVRGRKHTKEINSIGTEENTHKEGSVSMGTQRRFSEKQGEQIKRSVSSVKNTHKRDLIWKRRTHTKEIQSIVGRIQKSRLCQYWENTYKRNSVNS